MTDAKETFLETSRGAGSILFLPPLGSSFAFYEQTDESGAPSTSVTGYFAERNYDIDSYVPRYAGIPAGTCEAGLFDRSVMDSWDIASMLDDIAFIRGRRGSSAGRRATEGAGPRGWLVAPGCPPRLTGS